MTEAWLDFSLLTRAGFPLQRYEAGSKIFVQDDEGSAMFVVRSGRVNIDLRHGARDRRPERHVR